MQNVRYSNNKIFKCFVVNQYYVKNAKLVYRSSQKNKGSRLGKT